MDTVKEQLKTLKNLKNIDGDDVLSALGLQTRREPVEYVIPVLGIFGAGLLVGAGLGLLLAPKPGRKLRQEISKRAADVRDRAIDAIDEVRNN